MTVIHPIPPVCPDVPRVLILGSFPSVKSREIAFFYGHPQNRFWRVLSRLLAEPLPGTVEQKRSFLLRHGVALWDVIARCEIEGSRDSSIRNAVPNDLSPLLSRHPHLPVFTNGKTADALYRRLLFPVTGIPARCLPSTSPANAACREDDLCRLWGEALLPYLS